MVALRDVGNTFPRDYACLGERAARKLRDERRALLVRVDAVGREVRGARRRPREAARGRGKPPRTPPSTSDDEDALALMALSRS